MACLNRGSRAVRIFSLTMRNLIGRHPGMIHSSRVQERLFTTDRKDLSIALKQDLERLLRLPLGMLRRELHPIQRQPYLEVTGCSDQNVLSLSKMGCAQRQE